jgi:hypothetical protein
VIQRRRKPAQRAFAGLTGHQFEHDVSLPTATPPPAAADDVSKDKDADGERRDVLARIIKTLRRVHNLTATDVRTTFYPKSIESLRALAKEYDIKLPEPNPLDNDLLEQFENRQEKKKKDAERKRLERKSKSDQLITIKKQLRTPVAEVVKAAKQTELECQVEEREQRMALGGSGKYMTNAPHSKGELITGGNDSEQMGKMAAARNRAAFLGSTSVDLDTGEAFWPENDRGRVVPEGTGQRPSERESDEDDEDPDSTKDARDNKDERGRDADILPDDKFEVKLNDFDFDQQFTNLLNIYFVKVFSLDPTCNESYFICRLCERPFYWEREAKRHIEMVHGDERHPDHDVRFGDVIKRYIKSGRKAPKNLPTPNPSRTP